MSEGDQPGHTATDEGQGRGLQASLERVWYGARPAGPLLGMLERVYTRAAAVRRERTAPATDLLGAPIVVVGNLTAGGTGKTPLVIRLVELLQEAGLKAGVISRGHGRESSGQVLVNADTDPAESGDEPLLIARRTGAEVIVDRLREEAARVAFVRGADIVIADDGLQRASLPRAMEICVVDGRRGFGNGRLLPAGPLREPLERLREVDRVVCNGGELAPWLPPGLEVESVTMDLEPQGFHGLVDGESRSAAELIEFGRERPVHAVAGIGNPERFFATLEAMGLIPDQTHVFRDHHRYRPEDFAGLDGVVLMTEKDAVKCAAFAPVCAPLRNAWSLRVSAHLPAEWESSFVRRTRELVSAAALGESGS